MSNNNVNAGNEVMDVTGRLATYWVGHTMRQCHQAIALVISMWASGDKKLRK